MRGLMMDMPLMLSGILEHAAEAHATTEIVAREIDGSILRYDYARAHERAKRLAQALTRLGVRPGERVGTLAWNTHRHFEMFYGVSGTGAVLHTVNPRLFREQLVYIINHCEDSWMFCDLETLPLVEDLAPDLTTVKGYCLMADAADMPGDARLPDLRCYETLLDAEDGDYDWPVFDENSASSICYTSGTTGNPKGVVYSHRSMALATFTVNGADFMGGTRGNGAFDVALALSPMFHGNAWLLPYLAPMRGMKLVLPGRAYDAESLVELLIRERVTAMTGVPTFWLILLEHLRRTGQKLPDLEVSLSSGSAPPTWMVEELQNDFGVELLNTWGMTEALAATKGSLKPGDGELPPAPRLERVMRSGRATFGIKQRIVDEQGMPLPHDGKTLGHLQVKGPWIASGYFKDEGGSPLDDEGWFYSGDVAVIDAEGYLLLKDRSKDVIKSGGEWISSVEIENLAVGHPEIALAAVVAMPHPKWQERPLLVCTRTEGSTIGKEAVLDYLSDKMARWWMPDEVLFVEEIPMTATGKIMKNRLREDLERRGLL
jgi:fatty-acyl-CoA synthase